MHQVQSWRWLKGLLGAASLSLQLMGCTGYVVMSNSEGTGGRSGSSGGTGSTIGKGDPAACSNAELIASKRVVRLSFNQLANSIGTLINAPSLTEKLGTDNEILDREHRAFPPLQSPR